MFEHITKKDVLALNQQFSHGTIVNEGSLSFALFQANKTTSWLRACALLVRAVLIDHTFEDGNKRTSAAIIVTFFEERKVHYKPEDISKIIITMVTKNITKLNDIEREIKNVIIP